MKEDDDDIEEFKTLSDLKYRIPPSLECPSALKRKSVVVIPKSVMKEHDDDDIEEFKTPYDPKFRIPQSLECSPPPKRKSMEGTTPSVLFQLPGLTFFKSLCEKFRVFVVKISCLRILII
ncbi:unnamed protein product [Vicia faba]|uniref:Uncharacterized protein n=1 Tax=Vicia faba TaxID=3906 RepID=A0AAV0ZCT0_VICFA|nr:unnamed protein product [Vicia faba]